MTETKRQNEISDYEVLFSYVFLYILLCVLSLSSLVSSNSTTMFQAKEGRINRLIDSIVNARLETEIKVTHWSTRSLATLLQLSLQIVKSIH